MSTEITFLGSMFCGVAVFAFLVTIYLHLEGNRLTATRLAFDDLRRDMRRHPAHRVWWRAFGIAMGWRQRERPSVRHNDVTLLSGARYTKSA